MTLRPVVPLPMPDIVEPDLGPRPDIRWVSPASLLVDETYQRGMSRASVALLNKMVRNFAWNRMKVPNVVEVEAGLHLIDGQHTAIVAATLRVPEIPVFVVQAPQLAERARAFVGLNQDRVKVNPFNIYRALLASGDADAVAMDAVCKSAGIRLRAAINQTSAVSPGDTSAIGVIKGLVKRRGTEVATQVLEVLVNAKRAPISGPEIQAVEKVLCVEFKGVDAEQLMRIIRTEGDSGLISAHTQAKVTAAPVWRALVDRWKMKGLKGVRRVA